MWLRTSMIIMIGLIALGCVGERLERKEIASYNPSSVQEEKIKAWEQFNKNFAGKWKVEWNPITGTPHRISGNHIQVPEQITKENIEHVSRALLNEYKDLLQIDPDMLVMAKADFDSPANSKASRGTWYVYYIQKYRGLTVYGGSVRLVIRNQKVIVLASDYFPKINIFPKPKISDEEAFRIAAQDMSGNVFLRPENEALVIFPSIIHEGILYRLAWQITMPVTHIDSRLLEKHPSDKEMKSERIPVQWQYFIDARTGAIIERVNLMRDEELSGTVRGVVHESPTVSISNTPVFSENISLQSGTTVVTDMSGNYHFTGLPASSENLSASLKGPNVEVHNNETHSDAIHSVSVSIPGTHSWDWSMDDQSPNDVETNAFYHTNMIHDWFLRGAPFDVVPEPSPMQVYVRDGPYCNAFASPAGILLGHGNETCLDTALCPDIVYHEYTHRIVDKIYSDANVPVPYIGEGLAMDEAWADYFATSKTGNPYHAHDCMAGRNIAEPDRRYPDDIPPFDAHLYGLILSGALWDLRNTLGQDYVDNLAFRAIKHTPTSFSEYLGAFILEDNDPNYNPAGTSHVDDICHVFYEMHGVYHDDCIHHTEMPVALIIEPDRRKINFYNSSVSTIDITGSVHGSLGHPLQNFLIEYAHINDSSVWSSSGIILTNGGLSEIGNDTLGQWDVTGVPDDAYYLRLRAIDDVGQVGEATTLVVIDRTLKNGWPQLPDVVFYRAPAVADLDPSYPGLEIVASGDDYWLHAFHDDGTQVSGWPVKVSRIVNIAIGDVNGDGNLEVLAGTIYGSVFAIRANGIWFQTLQCGADYSYSTPALGDIEGDGKLDVIYSSTDNMLCAWHWDDALNNLTPVGGWPVTLPAGVTGTAALGDIDKGYEGQEIVIGALDGNVYAFRGDGSTVPGWPQSAGGEVRSPVSLADLDGDGNLEIVAESDRAIYIWKGNGELVTTLASDRATYSTHEIALADLDDDGGPEIIAGLSVWKNDGIALSGWPPSSLSGSPPESSPAIGDIDGAGHREVIGSYNYIGFGHERLFELQAFDHAGNPFTPGWPKRLGYYPYHVVLSQSGTDPRKVEIIAGSKGLFVWDLPAPYNEQDMEWPMYRHDAHRTGTHGLNCAAQYPDPLIEYDHIDAEGRVYIPVVNWSAYSNVLFRQAPELPPCGLNTKSSRTWVDIYNADTNARIYGFCALGTSTNLQQIWFKPAATSGRVYIIIHDRVCNTSYKSNTVNW